MYPRLNQVAPELIYRIIQPLPLESAAALSLTCRYLYYLLKEKYLDPLWQPISVPPRLLYPAPRDYPRANYSLALLYERDLPNHIACFHCKRYHYISEETAPQYILVSRPSLYGRHPKACINNYGFRQNAGSCISFYFAPTLFFMAMKRYRQGQDYEMFLKLLSSKELRLFSSSIVEWNHSSVRIQGNRFLFRYQSISTPAPRRPITSRSFWRKRICPHMEISAYPRSGHYHVCNTGEHFLTTIRRFDPFQRDEAEAFWKCQFCLTEVQFTYDKLHGNNISTFCTIWKDLGEGKSYLDPEWQSHLDHGRQELVDRILNGYPHVQRAQPTVVNFELGSIRSAFEQEHKLRLDSLITPAEARDMLKIGNALRSRSRFVVRSTLSKFFNYREAESKRSHKISNFLFNLIGIKDEKRVGWKREDEYIGCKAPSQLYRYKSEHYERLWSN